MILVLLVEYTLDSLMRDLWGSDKRATRIKFCYLRNLVQKMRMSRYAYACKMSLRTETFIKVIIKQTPLEKYGSTRD